MLLGKMFYRLPLWINDLPRKSLEYRTAFEVFHRIDDVAFDV